MAKKRVTISIDKELYEFYKKKKEEDPSYTMVDAIRDFYGKGSSKSENTTASGNVHPFEKITAKLMEKKLLKESDNKPEVKIPIPPPAPHKKETPPAPPVVVLGGKSGGKIEYRSNLNEQYNALLQQILDRLDKLEEKETKEKFKEELEEISDEYMQVFEEVQKKQGEINSKMIQTLENINRRLEKLEKKMEDEENINGTEIVKTLTETGTAKDIIRVFDKLIERAHVKDSLGTLIILTDLVPKWKEAGLSIEDISKILSAFSGGRVNEREEEY